jgi:S1-C subfamily serine protease
MRPSITYTLVVIALTTIISTTCSFLLFQHFSTAKLSTATSQKAQLTAKVNEAPREGIPPDFVNVSNDVTRSVVNIAVYRGDYRMSTGSGIILSDDGYIITNNHVIKGSTGQVVTLFDKKDYTAKIIGVDPSTDLALLKIEVDHLQPLRLGNSDQLRIGEWVIAVGHPFNLASTVTAGIVSAKARNIEILRDQDYAVESFIQTDAVVNPGNSGGALVNAKGELVGVNTAIISESGGYEGFSFAIPSNLVMKVAEDLRKYGHVQRAVLGVIVGDLNSSLAKDLQLSRVEGVYVERIRLNTTASVAGLKAKDVITAINNVAVRTMPELQEQIARYRPGDIISIDYIRNGVTYHKNGIELKPLK